MIRIWCVWVCIRLVRNECEMNWKQETHSRWIQMSNVFMAFRVCHIEKQHVEWGGVECAWILRLWNVTSIQIRSPSGSYNLRVPRELVSNKRNLFEQCRFPLAICDMRTAHHMICASILNFTSEEKIQNLKFHNIRRTIGRLHDVRVICRMSDCQTICARRTTNFSTVKSKAFLFLTVFFSIIIIIVDVVENVVVRACDGRCAVQKLFPRNSRARVCFTTTCRQVNLSGISIPKRFGIFNILRPKSRRFVTF